MALTGTTGASQAATTMAFLVAIYLSLSAIAKTREHPIRWMHDKTICKCESYCDGVLPGDFPDYNASFEILYGLEVVWQIPSRPIGGWFVMLHGGSGSALMYWPQSAGCSMCLGLPEEMVVTKEALSSGYAAVAISSLNRCTRNWAFEMDEARRVGQVLDHLNRLYGSANLMSILHGSSLGAIYASWIWPLLPMPVQGIISVVNSGVLRFSNDGHHPPTAFVSMVRDTVRHNMIGTTADVLRSMHAEAIVFNATQYQLTAGFFTNRIPGFGHKRAEAVLNILRKGGFPFGTDIETVEAGYIMEEIISKYPTAFALLGPYYYAFNEALTVAFGQHQFTSDHTVDALDWIRAQRSEKQSGLTEAPNTPLSCWMQVPFSQVARCYLDMACGITSQDFIPTPPELLHCVYKPKFVFEGMP